MDYFFLYMLALLLAYWGFVLFLWLQWEQIPVSQTPARPEGQGPMVTVIIPVRDEAGNIGDLLKDLSLQKQQNFEVFIINDASTDNTLQVIDGFTKNQGNNRSMALKVIDLPSQNHLASTKKAAITLGVSQANGELIVCTDGDCRVGENWLKSISGFYRATGAKFISGPVTFLEQSSFFSAWQTVEFASLIGTGAACMKAGSPNMCNGANMAFPKGAFSEIKGYAGFEHIASGDDEFLLHKIHKAFPGQAHFLKSRDALVRTSPQLSFGKFFQQRKRWASKWRNYQDPRPKVLAILVFAFHLSFTLCMALALAGLFGLTKFLSLFLIKVLVELLFIGRVLVFFKYARYIFWVPFVAMTHPVYVTVFGLLASIGPFKWKGRQFSQYLF